MILIIIIIKIMAVINKSLTKDVMMIIQFQQ